MSYTLDTYDPDADHDRVYTDECGSEIAAQLAVTLPLRVLEIGCATGRMTVQLASPKWKVLAATLDAEMIERARARNLPNVSWVCGNVMEFRNVEFDAIVCCSVLHEVPSPQAMLLKCHELLAPDGRVYVTVPSASSIHRDGDIARSEREERFGVRRTLMPGEWHDLMITGTGFKVVDREEMICKPYPNSRMACLPPGMLDYFAKYRGPGGAIVYFELASAT